MDDNVLFQVALSKISGVGSILGKQLIAYCGGVEAIFSESKRLLLRIPGVGEKLAHVIVNADVHELAKEDIQYYEKQNIKINFCLNDDYPSRLKHFDDAPLLFYSKGHFNPNPLRSVAIVGTRMPSSYGQQLTQNIVEDLKAYDVQIISGLAYGIDALAHKTANANKIQNLAIMGTGLDVVYPSAHKKLSLEIMKNGALISEYPINMRADKENFPKRNRVIAAMSDVVIVVQSAQKGGSLITAEFGNQYFKDVFAFPGRINDESSKGCNALIKQNKAHLLESVADIAYIMRWDANKPKKENQQSKLFVDLSLEERTVVDLLRQNEESMIDWIHKTAKMPMSQVASILLNLEFKGLVRALPGKRYVLA